MAVALERGHQRGQERHQPFGTDIIGRSPRDHQRVDDSGTILSGAGAHERAGCGDDRLTQELDGIRARIAGRGDELVEDEALLPGRCRMIPRHRLRQQLPFRLKTHTGPHSSPPLLYHRHIRVGLYYS